MTWFRVDDGLADHPKVLACSLAAMGLWVKAGAWCAKHLTDGALPRAAVVALGATHKHAAELVAAGLWAETPTGYAFHEWTERQPTREQVEKKRASTRERVERYRAGNASCNAVTDAATNAAPVPSRPVPYPEAAEEPPLPPVASLRGEDACLEFHRALNQPGGAAGNSYPYHVHAKDFDAIAAYAASCDDGNAGRTVLRALAEYFWLAPAGPIQSKRLERHRAKPKHLAENINRDAVEARNWYLARNRTEAAA